MDIVNRLQATADLGVPDYTNSKILREASDEIVRLRKALKAEREILDTDMSDEMDNVKWLREAPPT